MSRCVKQGTAWRVSIATLCGVFTNIMAHCRGQGTGDLPSVGKATVVSKGGACQPCIVCPMLVLSGAEDELVPTALGEAEVKLIPQAQLQMIARSGHAPPLGQVAEAVAAITANLG